jgi:hypothetical protein
VRRPGAGHHAPEPHQEGPIPVPGQPAPGGLGADVPRLPLGRRAPSAGGLPGGGLNIAFEAVGRHAHGPRADRIAIAWLGQDGGGRDLNYADLDRASSRFANVLASLGVGRGDVVFLLLPRIPDVHVCVLAL